MFLERSWFHRLIFLCNKPREWLGRFTMWLSKEAQQFFKSAYETRLHGRALYRKVAHHREKSKFVIIIWDTMLSATLRILPARQRDEERMRMLTWQFQRAMDRTEGDDRTYYTLMFREASMERLSNVRAPCEHAIAMIVNHNFTNIVADNALKGLKEQ